MGKEKPSQDEKLSPQAKNYLRDILNVLRCHYTVLGRAGMNLGRSRISLVNELSIDTIRLLVADDEFLYELSSVERDENVDPYQYLVEKEQELERGLIKPPKNSLTLSQGDILTRLAVVLEWGWQVANEKVGTYSYADVPVGKGIKIVKTMLEDLVDKNKVTAEFERIKNDPNKAMLYFKTLDFEIKDKLHEKNLK